MSVTKENQKAQSKSYRKIIKLSGQPEGFGQSPDELTADMFVSEMPTQHSYSYFEDDELGLYIGVWDTTDMVEAPGPYNCDEFMVLLEGAAEIKNNKTGNVETILAGESFVIPQGYDCQWQQQGYLRKFYVIAEHLNQAMPTTPVKEGIAKFKPSHSGIQYQHSTFISGIYKNEDLKLLENHAEVESHGHQFFFVNKGKLTLTESHEQTEGDALITEIKSGEAFFIPKGTVYRCESAPETIIHYVEM